MNDKSAFIINVAMSCIGVDTNIIHWVRIYAKVPLLLSWRARLVGHIAALFIVRTAVKPVQSEES